MASGGFTAVSLEKLRGHHDRTDCRKAASPAPLNSSFDAPRAAAFPASMLARVFAFLAFATLTHAGPPTIKAKTEEPVVEELMGGCSLKCSFDWHAEVLVPGAKPQLVRALDDDTALTAWTAADPAVGVGVKFRMVMPKKKADAAPEAPIYGLDLVNGCWKTEELWEKHARVKRARLHYNNKPFRDFTFADTRRWLRVEFPDIFLQPGDVLTFEILETYPGKGAGLAITELVLQGAH